MQESQKSLHGCLPITITVTTIVNVTIVEVIITNKLVNYESHNDIVDFYCKVICAKVHGYHSYKIGYRILTMDRWSEISCFTIDSFTGMLVAVNMWDYCYFKVGYLIKGFFRSDKLVTFKR